MYDTSKLRGRIIEKFGTMSAFAEASHKSMSFISQYMNGKKNLDQPTMESWINLLDIPALDIGLYFFIPKVHESEQKGGA